MSLWINPRPCNCPIAPDNAHSEAQELPDLHRFPNEAIEWLAACVID